MTNLETLEKGIKFTYEMYKQTYTGDSYEEITNQTQLKNKALQYSSDVICYMLRYAPSVWATAYTSKGGLREDILSLSSLDVKNELLKNVVKIASYNRINDTRDSNYLGFEVNDTMSDDGVCVVLSNVMQYQENGVENVYSLLEQNDEVLKSVCRSFVSSRIDPKKRQILDDTVATYQPANEILNDLDVYYARRTSRNNYQM